MKGETVGIKSDRARRGAIIPVPEAMLALHSSVTLCVDIVFVNSLIFLSSIYRKLKCISTTTYIEGRKHKMLLSVLLKNVSLYKARGFKVEFV